VAGCRRTGHHSSRGSWRRGPAAEAATSSSSSSHVGRAGTRRLGSRRHGRWSGSEGCHGVSVAVSVRSCIASLSDMKEEVAIVYLKTRERKNAEIWKLSQKNTPTRVAVFEPISNRLLTVLCTCTSLSSSSFKTHYLEVEGMSCIYSQLGGRLEKWLSSSIICHRLEDLKIQPTE
jgi:hypothetical protein